MTFYTYVLKCADESFYTGWTTNLPGRLKAHNSGLGAKYTRARLPVCLIACWEFASKAEAMSWEWHIKQLTRQQKLRLIQEKQSPAADQIN